MDVVMIYFYSKRFRFAPSFNYFNTASKKNYEKLQYAVQLFFDLPYLHKRRKLLSHLASKVIQGKSLCPFLNGLKSLLK